MTMTWQKERLTHSSPILFLSHFCFLLVFHSLPVCTFDFFFAVSWNQKEAVGSYSCCLTDSASNRCWGQSLVAAAACVIWAVSLSVWAAGASGDTNFPLGSKLGSAVAIRTLIQINLFVGKLNDPNLVCYILPPGSACGPTLAYVGGHRLDPTSCWLLSALLCVCVQEELNWTVHVSVF